ncbi:MAG: 3-oxoacyl-ACP reductase FabG [Gammaproteobacteria bacterium]|nr:3-oxoacyl-ACP reductase FabG [Gammaproteobacteria bacterium]
MTESKRILITGSSRGIGKAIAIQLAQDGFAVVVNGFSNSARLDETVEEIRASGGRASSLFVDVRDRTAVRCAINKDIEASGAYYGVVCNAGLHRDAAFPAMTDSQWDEVIDVNLGGFYNVAQPCIMPMVRMKQGGRIVAISSISGIMGNRGQVNYSAAKAGLIGATKALAIELAKRRITVNCVAPGIIESDMSEEVAEDIVRQMVPMRRRGKDSEVASLVGYLMSDPAAYITRQVISVNGGMA